MTDVVSAFSGQEQVSVCEAGDDFLSIDLQFLVLGSFFYSRVGQSSFLITYVESVPGFPSSHFIPVGVQGNA